MVSSSWCSEVFLCWPQDNHWHRSSPGAAQRGTSPSHEIQKAHYLLSGGASIARPVLPSLNHFQHTADVESPLLEIPRRHLDIVLVNLL